ncbi:MAG: phosphate acyltransferase PlsX [Candidatus Marinimicrobia bacterium]|nr:phosphate acyltransferase PlsX [Candidatus Neomarinimicrobiota bacterium]
MIIALDAMGGDNAPEAVVQGAIQALSESPSDLSIVLLGDENTIDTVLDGFISPRLSIIHTTQIVGMHDRASKALKTKPDSSLVRGIQMVTNKEANAFVSAGNTGAVMTTSLLSYGRIKHVKRPTLGVYIPTLHGGKILCDVGANPDAKPYHILQSAIMASHYFDHVENHKNPKVGLINIGAEPNKGSELYQETYQLLKKELPNFIGNIEGRHIMDCEADVLVCDGFVGNILLKFAEGWVNVFSNEIKARISDKFSYKIGALLLKPVFKGFAKKFDYEEHGGTPLLGVNGVSIITHGSAGPKAVCNSVLLAKKCIDENLIEDIRISLEEHLGASA